MKQWFIILIVILAIFFRFNNLNWDSNFHLQPDERFLTMVGNSIKIPGKFLDYFNPRTSTLNPANVSYKFFVYGQFPLTLNKLLAVVFNNDNYNDFTILGRFLSAFFDLVIVILVYKTAKLLSTKVTSYKLRVTSFPLWSAFFYAISVLPIQLSHFFAVDSFLNFFMFGSFYCALKSSEARTSGFWQKIKGSMILSAIFFGLALACKITAIFILPLNLFFILFNNKKIDIKRIILLSIFYFLSSYFVLRLADPYLFQSANFFDPRPNKIFVENLRQLKSFSGANVWYPPAVQWIHKPPVIFSLVNLAVFGVGIPYFILVILGMVGVISKIKDQRSKTHSKNQKENNNETMKQWNNIMIILIWVATFFLYQSTQFAKPMRYFIFIYPFLAIFAALGINQLINFGLRITDSIIIRNASFVILIILLIVWPLMFSTIYFHKHTRIEASEWIYRNLPNTSIILGEEWDDPLPLSVKETYGKQFRVEILPVFSMDTTEKWQKMNDLLSRADYYILSSNRGWGSITTVPEKYPKMSQFYNNLLANSLSYQKIKEFKPYYYRFFELPNDWIDESFTVYDHPTVMIFEAKKTN